VSPSAVITERNHVVAIDMPDRIERRRWAEQIVADAASRGVVLDAGDVEHALSYLTLPPWERLARSRRRSRLKRFAVTP